MKASANLLSEISGNKFILLLPFLSVALSCITTHAQERSDNYKVQKQIKDVTATGPFPFFVSVHPYTLLAKGNADVKKTFHYGNQYKGSALSTPKNAWGFAINGGVRVLRTGIVEAGYTQFSRGQADGPLDLRITERIASLRLGASFGIYYPISVQAYAGYTSAMTDFTIIESNGGTETKRRISIGENVLKGRKGFEWGARLVLMDPVGAGGGLGGYFEFRQIFAESVSYAPYLRALDPAASDTFSSDTNYRIFTIGFVAPLALRGMIGK